MDRNRERPRARRRVGLAALVATLAGCVAGGDLAVSAGAPVSGAVQGTVLECGRPVADVGVTVHLRQDQSGQARPVDQRVGPVVTDAHGRYAVELEPAFAVPGPATVALEVTLASGAPRELSGATIELRLGTPPPDTLRLDADVGLAAGGCR
ncbi:MAG TPA: hypothetical protein VFJ81_15805 [Gemmatimonadales bacterium]|nr:hypothetical protein [Gemmatimonadales bacterium]